MADAGVASRRVCERLIEEGRVEVNGAVVTVLPVFVDLGIDSISVDGKPVSTGGSRGVRRHYILLHKPEKVLTTAADEPGLDRRTVTDLVNHPSNPRLFPVGRLGWDETGLVLLTNDGELANRLSHPRYGIPKTYLAIVKGDVSDEDLHRLGRRMFKLQRLSSRQAGRPRGAHVEMSVYKREPGKTTLRVVMREGKNRYVAEVLGLAGFPVRKIAAVAIGPLQLKGLPIGSWRELTRDEVKSLRAACHEGATAEKKSPQGRGRVSSRRREGAGSAVESRRPSSARPGSSARPDRPLSPARPSRPSQARHAGDGADGLRNPGRSTRR